MLQIHDINDKDIINQFAKMLENSQQILFKSPKYVFSISRNPIDKKMWNIKAGSHKNYFKKGFFECCGDTKHSAKHAIEYMLCG